MVDILVTNDDGYTSQAFIVLKNELEKDYHVVGVAPKSEKSWIGKSISAHEELALEKISENLYSLTGTPADCVQVGIYDVLKKKPRFVVSGINIGLNAGHARILSSGTVGAAMEASIDGVRSISASLHLPEGFKKMHDFHDKKCGTYFINSAKIIRKIIKIFEDIDFDDDTDLLSVNIPFEADINTPFEITVPDRQPIGQLFHKSKNSHKHINPEIFFDKSKKGTDLWALNHNKISITPISLKLVSKSSIEKINDIVIQKW